MSSRKKPVAQRFDWRTILKEADETPASIIAALDEYFSTFAAQGEGKCLKCGRDLGGLLGTFVWGLVHGEGFCSNCHWPARAHHFVRETDDAEPFFTVRNFILQYHPDFVTFRRRRKAA